MPSSSRFWPTRAETRRRHRLMRRMIRVAGLKPQEVAKVDGGLAILEARTKCSYCQHEEACVAWLKAAGMAGLPPDFCANGRLLRALREAAMPRDLP
jgi:Family of unknown function (DUF6455)